MYTKWSELINFLFSLSCLLRFCHECSINFRNSDFSYDFHWILFWYTKLLSIMIRIDQSIKWHFCIGRPFNWIGLIDLKICITLNNFMCSFFFTELNWKHTPHTRFIFILLNLMFILLIVEIHLYSEQWF